MYEQYDPESLTESAYIQGVTEQGVNETHANPNAADTSKEADAPSAKETGKGEGTFAARFCGPNETGKPLDAELAQGIRCMMTEKMEEKALNEVMEGYETPAKLPELCVPLVNETIWTSLSPKVRSVDCKMQRVQKYIIKGMTAGLTDMTAADAKKNNEDSWACLTAANNELNMLRRELIKPELNQRFAHLCRPSVKVTNLLFGDDLGKQIKDLTESQKATWQVICQKSWVSVRWCVEQASYTI